MKHKWGQPYRTDYETVRTCEKCGLQKITHHDPGLVWIEWRRDESRIRGTKTPPCESAVAGGANGQG